VGDKGWEVHDRVVEARTETQVREVRREVSDGLVELCVKSEVREGMGEGPEGFVIL
jgi:hypothetical protein